MKLGLIKQIKEKIKSAQAEPEVDFSVASRATPGKEASVQDIVAPSAIEVDFNELKINDRYARTLFVAGYPRYVSANWLSPLINFDHSLDISMFIYPVESKTVLDDLRRKVAEMEAEIATDLERGKVVDPATQAKLEDAQVMQQQLVKGAERFFQFGLYVTITADSLEELSQVSRGVESTLASLLIIPKSATLQMEEGFKTTLPTCLDYLNITRNMDTTSLATTFPFSSSELTANEGILYGLNEHNESLIVFDRFTLENYNSTIFAKAGAGKSISANDVALFDDGSGVKLNKIGPLVERLIAKHGARQIAEEIEGVINPGLKAWTFDRSLKGQWSPVRIAARKKFSPRKKLYLITTKSGRQITVTADHNLVILRKGKIQTIQSGAVKIGEAVPLARKVGEPLSSPRSIKPTESVTKWSEHLPDEIPLQKEFLNLLGLITSEGHATEGDIIIYNTHPKILSLIKKSAAKLRFGVSPRYNYPSRIISGFRIGTNLFAQLVFSLGGCGKSGEKRIPSIIFSLKNEQVAHYLRAYYEGDGGVESKEVNAVTKSKELASDLSYLLLRFGIVTRLHPKRKAATNTVKQTKRVYYQVTISGKENLSRFARGIGFLTKEKNLKLQKALENIPTSNSNVDTVPGLQPLFNDLYRVLFSSSEIASPVNLSDLKRGGFNPSRPQLTTFVNACEKRLAELRSLRPQIQLLRQLPTLQRIIQRGSQNRHKNRLLWQTLGQSWNTIKQQLHPPLAKNALLAYRTVSGQTVALPDLNQALYRSFRLQGESLMKYNHSLWESIVSRPSGNARYHTISEAARHISKKFRSTQLTIRHAEKKLAQLKLLANSDLFWDPITKIERVKHKERYVYDLQVDNGVFLAGTAGMFVHNSYLVKLEVLRSLMFDAEVIIIDPENEYEKLCRAVGGEYITFGFNSKAKVNPFDLSQVREEGENEINQKLLSLHSLFKVIMGSLTASEEAILDRALVLTYQMKGITQDPETQTKEPPLLEDLYKALVGMEDPQARTLADRIEKYVKGSFSGIFDQHSNVNLANPFTVFSLRDLEQALRPVAMFIILDYIWTRIRRELKKRILVVDEAWFMMRSPDSANFLTSIAKRARKYYLGLTTITQDVEDFFKDDLGKEVVTNSSIQILMKQHPAAIDRVSEIFYLSEGEKQFLLSCDIGEGLFFAGNNHVAMKVIASPQEHSLITTDPREILAAKKPITEPKAHATPPPDLVIPPTTATPATETAQAGTPPPEEEQPPALPPRFKSEIIVDNGQPNPQR